MVHCIGRLADLPYKTSNIIVTVLNPDQSPNTGTVLEARLEVRPL